MLITVSGPAGSGKSTLAADLADRLGYEHVSGGDIFREIAAERGLSPLELNRLAEKDDEIDRDLDRRLRSTARERDDLVLESRLAGWMAGEYADLRVWLDAPVDVRAARIADREDKPTDQAREETTARADSEALRYREYYGIDIEDLRIYDLVVNTARWGPEGVVDLVHDAVGSYDPGTDEGKNPVTGVAYAPGRGLGARRRRRRACRRAHHSRGGRFCARPGRPRRHPGPEGHGRVADAARRRGAVCPGLRRRRQGVRGGPRTPRAPARGLRGDPRGVRGGDLPETATKERGQAGDPRPRDPRSRRTRLARATGVAPRDLRVRYLRPETLSRPRAGAGDWRTHG
ncbi:MAG: hypothetical protein BRD23_08000 [Halobacteriales archaeon SW_9_67_25]|nr:MAG: hypothetical protein BRD23_08000 [Halobacteriales archaeon SW_9_67_25]